MQHSATILVIEDDGPIRKGIADALAVSGFEVLEAADGSTGMRRAVQATYDLLLLDLVLPGHSGFEVLAELRQSRPSTPVIILSARGEEADRIRGLKMGADDYVVKPFSVRELLARIEAVLRRSAERPAGVETIEYAGGTIDLERSEIRFRDGSRSDLSTRETELLRYLAGHSGRSISRDEILQRVWRIDPRNVETRTIDMHVKNLRAKLRDREDPLVLTVRGKGYMLRRSAAG